jgi:hypothetical protein
VKFSSAWVPGLRGAGLQRAGSSTAAAGKCWLAGLALAAVGPVLAVEPSAADSSVLPKSAYRVPMEEVIAIGRVPYWRKDEKPKWEREEMELQESKARMQWAPAYTRDERDEYNGIRDSVNPQPRAKIFEVKF